VTVRRQDLGNPAKISEGGQGKVFEVKDFRLPGYPHRLAYKEVLPELSPTDRADVLRAMNSAVTFRAGLPAADRTDLDRFAAWPLEMVEDGGRLCGMLMPLLHAEFLITVRPGGGPPETQVFDLSWLCAPDSVAQKNAVERSAFRDASDRLVLLAKLVHAVGRLHRLGVVYGDINLRNAAVAAGPPRITLLDCDATALLTDTGRRQPRTAGFDPPELKAGRSRLQDKSTDVYKLGLCIVRCLQQGRGATQATDPATVQHILGPHCFELVRRALDPDPGRRPSAKELYLALEQLVVGRVSPPELHTVTLDRTRILRGTDVEVGWVATGATTVRIRGERGVERVVQTNGVDAMSCRFAPHATGALVVEALNRHGSVDAPVGRVEVVEVPQFVMPAFTLPGIRVPALPAVDVPRPRGAPAYPALPVLLAVELPRVHLTLEPLGDALTTVGEGLRRTIDLTAAAAEVHRVPDLFSSAVPEVRSLIDDHLVDLRDRLRQEAAARAGRP
jgi:hypothetical protein